MYAGTVKDSEMGPTSRTWTYTWTYLLKQQCRLLRQIKASETLPRTEQQRTNKIVIDRKTLD